MKCIKLSSTPAPNIEILNYMFDIKKWLEPISLGIHNIIYPHCFKFVNDSDGKCVMKYKNWSGDKTWLPENTDGIHLTKVRLEFFL